MNSEEQVAILLVDDKPANLVALKELLNKEGRIFYEATDGNEALKIAFDRPVDLVILDVQMPGLDGFEVAKTLKSNRRTQDIPIIFASAEMKEYTSMLKGLEEGAVEYLVKPLDPDITRAKVQVLLQLQLQRKELVEKNRSLEAAENEIRLLNAHLQRNVEKLELANKELESFSYSVSHDLRAPLRAVNGYARIMEEDYGPRLDAEARRLLGNIRENALRMGTLIEDLLEFSRSGRRALHHSEVDMDKLVRQVVEEISSTVVHSAEIQVNSLPAARGDHPLLVQVWDNLVRNAIKYSSKKEKPLIEIGSVEQEEEQVYFIRDNGAGFDMNYLDKLFGVFQRLHAADEYEGTGIGLAIVRRIISRHGGRTWAEGKVDKGAVFYFSLPWTT